MDDNLGWWEWSVHSVEEEEITGGRKDDIMQCGINVRINNYKMYDEVEKNVAFIFEI